ncbi:MAG TPA: hypothetical protein VNG31_06945 [Candidatus Baltobacteraceae bacterium]|nr:hypothetical protein [Candidatus Baltobacteraceae bacterium]
MKHEQRLVAAVSDGSLLPTFEQWVESSGYRSLVDRIRARATLTGQVYAMRSLYDWYKRELLERRH